MRSFRFRQVLGCLLVLLILLTGIGFSGDGFITKLLLSNASTESQPVLTVVAPDGGAYKTSDGNVTINGKIISPIGRKIAVMASVNETAPYTLGIWDMNVEERSFTTKIEFDLPSSTTYQIGIWIEDVTDTNNVVEYEKQYYDLIVEGTIGWRKYTTRIVYIPLPEVEKPTGDIPSIVYLNYTFDYFTNTFIYHDPVEFSSGLLGKNVYYGTSTVLNRANIISYNSNDNYLATYYEVTTQAKVCPDQFVESIFSKAGQYPKHGEKDGYFYVRIDYTTYNPNMAVFTPIKAGQEEIQVKGVLADQDSWDITTVHYSIDNGEQILCRGPEVHTSQARSFDFRINIKDLEVGIHTIKFSVKDMYSNTLNTKEFQFEKLPSPSNSSPSLFIDSDTNLGILNNERVLNEYIVGRIEDGDGIEDIQDIEIEIQGEVIKLTKEFVQLKENGEFKISLKGIINKSDKTSGLITITVKDASEETDSLSLSYTQIDIDNPILEITNIENGDIIDSAITPNILYRDDRENDSGIDVVLMTLDGEEYIENTEITKTGNHTLSVFVKDKAGNEVTKSVNFKIEKRLEGAILSHSNNSYISQNDNPIVIYGSWVGAYSPEVIVTLSSPKFTVNKNSRFGEVLYNTDANMWYAYISPNEVESSDNVMIHLYLENDGAVTFETFVENIIIDFDAPAIKFNVKENEVKTTDKFKLIIDVTDELSGVDTLEVRTKNGTYYNQTEIELEGYGDHTVVVEARDKAGNFAVKTLSVTLNGPPTISIDPISDKSISRQDIPISITGVANDPYHNSEIEDITVRIGTTTKSLKNGNLSYDINSGRWETLFDIDDLNNYTNIDIECFVIDRYDISSSDKITGVLIDLELPQIETSIDELSYVNVDSLNVSINAVDNVSGIKNISSLVNNEIELFGDTITLSGYGKKNLKITVEDNAGNILQVVRQIELNAAPEINVDIPSALNLNMSYFPLIITGTAQDLNGNDTINIIKIKYNGVEISTNDFISYNESTGKFSVTLMPEFFGNGVENATLIFEVYDKYNVMASDSITFSYIDVKAPTYSVQPQGLAGIDYRIVDSKVISTNKGLKFNYIVTDDLSGVSKVDYTIIINGKEYKQITNAPNQGEIEIEYDGTYSIVFYIEDNTGNNAQHTVIEGIIDSTAPFVKLMGDSVGNYARNITIGIEVTDNISGVDKIKYVITNSNVTPTVWKYYTKPTEIGVDGTYYLHFNATDLAGNERIGYFGPFVIELNKEPDPVDPAPIPTPTPTPEPSITPNPTPTPTPSPVTTQTPNPNAGHNTDIPQVYAPSPVIPDNIVEAFKQVKVEEKTEQGSIEITLPSIVQDQSGGNQQSGSNQSTTSTEYVYKTTIIDKGTGEVIKTGVVNPDTTIIVDDLPDGSAYVITITIIDEEGNIVGVIDIPVVIKDTTPPVITSVEVEGNNIVVYAVDNVKLADKAFALSSVEVRPIFNRGLFMQALGSVGVSNYTINWSSSNRFTYNNSTKRYTAYVRDEAGNVASMQIDIDRLNDTLANVINKEDPYIAYPGNTFNVYEIIKIDDISHVGTSNPDVATVDTIGNVTPIGDGFTIIRIYDKNGDSKALLVRVSSKAENALNTVVGQINEPINIVDKYKPLLVGKFDDLDFVQWKYEGKLATLTQGIFEPKENGIYKVTAFKGDLELDFYILVGDIGNSNIEYVELKVPYVLKQGVNVKANQIYQGYDKNRAEGYSDCLIVTSSNPKALKVNKDNSLTALSDGVSEIIVYDLKTKKITKGSVLVTTNKTREKDFKSEVTRWFADIVDVPFLKRLITVRDNFTSNVTLEYFVKYFSEALSNGLNEPIYDRRNSMFRAGLKLEDAEIMLHLMNTSIGVNDTTLKAIIGGVVDLNKQMTRSEVAQIIYEVYGSKLKLTAQSKKFKDINKCKYPEAMRFMVEAELIYGCGDNTVRGDNIISKAELFTILNRLNDKLTGDFYVH